MKAVAVIKIAIVLLTVTFLTACNPSSIRRDSRLEDSLLYYKIQMNRSNFGAAAGFRASDSPWDVRGLDRIQLTDYTVQQSTARDEGKTIERVVMLRYIDRYTMRERSTIYKEIWKYDNGVWKLSGEPPEIR